MNPKKNVDKLVYVIFAYSEISKWIGLKFWPFIAYLTTVISASYLTTEKREFHLLFYFQLAKLWETTHSVHISGINIGNYYRVDVIKVFFL